MTENASIHWQAVYETKQANQVSWFAPHLEVSLDLLKKAGLNPGSRIIDVGAGASTLVDDLLDLGLSAITAVDISAAALMVAQQRLGARVSQVQWRVANATQMELPINSYDLWHDRAVLHFLVDSADVAAYVARATGAIVNGGHAVIGGFASDGPQQCSGLNVARREPQDIAELFGSAFSLIHSQHVRHITPWGASQSFAYALLHKVGDV